MSNAIPPIVDAVDSQRTILLAEEQKREVLAKHASDDQVQRAQDDAAALALRLAQLRSQDQVLNNIKDTLNATAAAHAAVGASGDLISARLRDLARQMATDGVSAAERATLQIEFDTLKLKLGTLPPAAASNGTPPAASQVAAETEAAAQASTRGHDLIVKQTAVSVTAQANQDSEVALNLLDE